MNFKNFKPFERIPMDIQMMICKNAHILVYQEVMRELKVKNTLFIFEEMVRNIKIYNEKYSDLNSMPTERDIDNDIQDILVERYLAGYVDLVPSYFKSLKECNCCEYHHFTNLNLEHIRRMPMPISGMSKFYTDTCKCNCIRFRYICIDTEVDYKFREEVVQDVGETEFPFAEMLGVVLY